MPTPVNPKSLAAVTLPTSEFDAEMGRVYSLLRLSHPHPDKRNRDEAATYRFSGLGSALGKRDIFGGGKAI